MKAIIQKTKLRFPTARVELVERPRLLQELNTLWSPGRRVGLISAPAGSGKTTLVVQWLVQPSGWPAGWVSLDARDNQPSRFFTYFIAALQTMYPEAGKEALELLQLPGVNLAEVVSLLTNDLVETPSPFLVVLDDFHNITNPALCEAIDLFLDAQPPQMRLLLLSREDPALQMARRRASHQLVELRQNDLRFTLAEAVDFLKPCMGLDLMPAQVELLEARTEGWIAGLQMAALSLQHSTNADRFIHDFSGSNRYILDYLMEEVLLQQSQQMQDFLLETSCLDQMCAELCEYVIRDSSIRDSSIRDSLIRDSGKNQASRITSDESRIDRSRIDESQINGSRILSSSQSILERLEKANLFVIPLDEERCWYRYHHLFKDLLLARLRGDAPQRESLLCRRAADWYEENGDPRQAVEYALKARDVQHAADLVEKHFTERWQIADLEFCALVNQLPMEVVSARPSLCLDSAWLCILAGQYGRVPPFLEAAERCLSNPGRSPDPTDAANRAFARIVRAFLDDFQNQPVKIDEPLKQAFAAIPETDIAMRNSVAVLFGTICYMEGDFASVIQYSQDALERDTRTNGTISIPISAMRWVWALQAQGKLRQALDRIREYETYVRQRGSRRFYISGVLNLMWGDILYEWNRLDEAEAQLQLGLRLLEDWSMPQPLSLGLSLLIRLQAAQGKILEARAALQKAESIYQAESFHPAFIHAFQGAQVCLWIAEQNVSALETFASQTVALTAQELSFRVEAPLIELCRAWIALGRFDEAAALLKRLSDLAEGRSGSRIKILALLAAAQSRQPALSRAALEDALRLGEPEGYVRSFIDAGQPLRSVLNAWLQEARPQTPKPLRDYAIRILSAFEPLAAAAGPETRPAAVLIEELTPRELDVLHLLASGCSNSQIAEKLVIAEGTVKFYVHEILEKFEVHNRTRAVARARELGLI